MLSMKMKDRFSKSSETRRAEMPNPQHDFVSLRGYEADRKFRDCAGRTLRSIGDSDVFNEDGLYLVDTGVNSHLTFFTMPNGGKVFAAGTIQYSWGLDGYSPIEHVTGWRIHGDFTSINAQNLTANMLDKCLLSGLPCQF